MLGLKTSHNKNWNHINYFFSHHSTMNLEINNKRKIEMCKYIEIKQCTSEPVGQQEIQREIKKYS